jgi:hypothetical protein
MRAPADCCAHSPKHASAVDQINKPVFFSPDFVIFSPLVYSPEYTSSLVLHFYFLP